MGRSFLVLGLFAAGLGCLASAVQVISSIMALVDRTKSLTDAMLAMPLYWAYGVIINAALFVVFGRVMEMKRKPTATARGEQVLADEGKRGESEP